jgi:hypothetical protein
LRSAIFQAGCLPRGAASIAGSGGVTSTLADQLGSGCWEADHVARARGDLAEPDDLVVSRGPDGSARRPIDGWSGGAQWATRIPSTHGRTVTRFFSFRPYAWGPVSELGEPTHPFATALAEARGFVFVGKTANELEFRGLRVDRYTPPCIDPEGVGN